MSLANPNGELRYVNPAYAAFYGKQPGEFVGRNLFDLASPALIARGLRRICDRFVQAIALSKTRTRLYGRVARRAGSHGATGRSGTWLVA